jgi:hypothetical protein
MIEWMDGWMDEMSKSIKIGDYILYAKNNYEGRRRKIFIQKKMEIIWD